MGGLTAALDNWRLIRRYAVPEWMIAECTEARERGDWRAACEAARVTVAFDESGPAEELLAGFAPDLLRWHLPRAMDGTAALATGLRFVLAPEGPISPGTVVLGVRAPDWSSSSQRLTLHAVRAGDLAEGPVFPLPPYLWDARRAGELRAAAHGSATRLPFFTPAGDRLPVEEFGVGDDEPARAERVRGTAGTVEAWASAGWQFDEGETRRWLRPEIDVLGRADPLLAIRELRRVAAQFGRWSWELRADKRRSVWPGRHLRLEAAGDRHRVVGCAARPQQPGSIRAEPCLYPGLLRSPIDLDLIRYGRIGVGELHPLVRAALFPAAARPALDVSLIPDGFAEGERIRVRCGTAWHWIGLRGGRLELHHHTEAERRRERALRAFGGKSNGCFSAEMAWQEGEGVAPKRLRTYRRDLWRRMEHGGSRVVLALLDAGMDPHLRDAKGQTLLHHLHQFEHAELLPRLLAEGLDINVLNRRSYTPMCEAVVHSAPNDLLMDMNEAGALPQLSLMDPQDWPEPEIESRSRTA